MACDRAVQALWQEVRLIEAVTLSVHSVAAIRLSGRSDVMGTGLVMCGHDRQRRAGIGMACKGTTPIYEGSMRSPAAGPLGKSMRMMAQGICTPFVNR